MVITCKGIQKFIKWRSKHSWLEVNLARTVLKTLVDNSHCKVKFFVFPSSRAKFVLEIKKNLNLYLCINRNEEMTGWKASTMEIQKNELEELRKVHQTRYWICSLLFLLDLCIITTHRVFILHLAHLVSIYLLLKEENFINPFSW